MRTWAGAWALLLALAATRPHASRAAFDDLAAHCRCVLFNVTSGKFHSPEFPSPLENVECLFYHFQAPKDHFVRITFDVFHLPPRIGTCSSSVLLYDHSMDGLVDFDQKADFEFCGKEIPSGRQFYSRDEHMLLQIRHNRESSRGFSGTFFAIPKANFTTEAVEVSECSFRVEKNKALLYSPHYPYFYPSRVNCTYVVPQRKGFQKHEKKRLESVRSGQRNLYVTSLASLIFHFVAGGNDFERAVGFVIELQYASAVWPAPSTSGGPTTSSECLLQVNSDNFKEGTLSSEKIGRFASSMPTKCRVVFQGYPNEKISLKFTHFNLYVPDNVNISKRCTDVDYMSADVRVGARLSRIDEWCGRGAPPNLMSSTNLIQIEYATKSSRLVRESTNEDIGFRLEYKFHTDWNMDPMKAKADRSKECRFLFNSTEHTNGKLWSVNYPGLYPRNLYCEYIFHGRNDEIVHIHFEYFDIEGFQQCDETTQSDYILFSNYQTHDRTNRRFCGKVTPRGPILSESNYFRMIFFTNDIFDATGFYAHYQFITQEKSQINRVKLTTSDGAFSFAPTSPALIFVAYSLLTPSL